MQSVPELNGKRVLLVEDETLVGMLMEDLLVDMGCVVVESVATLRQAIEAARAQVMDLAVLDVNLGGQRSYPVAEVLEARRIPFVFLSGYGDGALPPGRTALRACGKPIRSTELARVLTSLVTAKSIDASG